MVALPPSAISGFFNLPAGPSATESIWILRFIQKSAAGEDGETAYRYLMLVGCLEQFDVAPSTDLLPKMGLVREVEEVAYPKNP